jgi:hypothetical protein
VSRDSLLRLLDAGGGVNPIRENNSDVRVTFLSLSRGLITGLNLPPDLNCVEGECISNGTRPALYRSSRVIAVNTAPGLLNEARTALVGIVYPDQLTAVSRFPPSTVSVLVSPLPLVTSILNTTTDTDITLVLTVTTPASNPQEEEELFNFFAARRAFFDKGGTFLRVLLIANDSNRTAQLITRRELEPYNFKVITDLTAELLMEFECGVVRSGIWTTAVYTDVIDINGSYFMRGAVEGNAVWSVNVGAVCERTGSVAITNRGVVIDAQGIYRLASDVPGRPYLEVTRVTPTTVDYLYRYYGLNRLPYHVVKSVRNPQDRIVDTEQLCWGLLALSLSIPNAVTTITLVGDKDKALEQLLEQTKAVLAELVQVNGPRAGTIPALLHADATPNLVYGEEAEHLRLIGTVRLVEEGCVAEECLEVTDDPFNVSRAVSNLAVALYAAITRDPRSLSYLSRRGNIDSGWLDGIPLDTSEPTGIIDAPTQLATALAFLLSGEDKYLPLADVLLNNARVNFYRNQMWNDQEGPTARSVAIGALLDYITDHPLPNSIPSGPNVYQSLGSALIPNINPLDTMLGLVTDINPTWVNGLDSHKERYRRYCYQKERVLERMMSILPFISNNRTTRSLLQAITPNIAIIKETSTPRIRRTPGVTNGAIRKYLEERGYQGILIKEPWRRALYPQYTQPSLGISTLGLGILEPTIAHVTVSVRGRFEDPLEVAMGVVLIRESCIDSTGQLLTQTTVDPVIDTPPLECTWEFWAGLHCCD